MWGRWEMKRNNSVDLLWFILELWDFIVSPTCLVLRLVVSLFYIWCFHFYSVPYHVFLEHWANVCVLLLWHETLYLQKPLKELRKTDLPVDTHAFLKPHNGVWIGLAGGSVIYRNKPILLFHCWYQFLNNKYLPKLSSDLIPLLLQWGLKPLVWGH